MKVLEAQNSVVSNHEVYHHLVSRQSRRKANNQRGLATIVNEVLKYLRTPPNPFPSHGQSRNYDNSVVLRLLERLDAANLNQDLAKGEVLMILNLRPSSNAVLNTVIEDMEERFSEDEQNAILDIIAEVLGGNESGTKAQAGHNGIAVPSVENGA